MSSSSNSTLATEDRAAQLVRYAGDVVRADGDGISAVIGASADGAAIGLFLGGDAEDAELAAIAAGATPRYTSDGVYDWRTAIDSVACEIDHEIIVADYAAPKRWGRRPKADDRDWAGLDAADYPVTALRIGPIDSLFAATCGEAVDNRVAMISRALES